MILDKNASVARLSPNSEDNDKESYVEIDSMGNIPINIQPASSELIAVTDGALGQTYRAFTTISGISIGDRITVSGINSQYIVRGVEDWFWGPIPHLELVLYKGDN